MLERFLLVWLVILGTVAYYWQRWLPGVPDPFLLSRPTLPYYFAVTMFAIGAILPLEEVRQVGRRWPTVLGGTLVQYTSMPLLGYWMSRLCGLDEAATIGTVMAGCVPGAMASNVLTLVARGNTSYSVSLTTSATLVSPVVVPLLLWLSLGEDVPLEVFLDAAVQLAWMVVLPVVAGHALTRWLPRWQPMAQRVGPVVANLTILWIIAVVVAGNRQYVQFSPRLALALLGLNLGGYLAGYLGGGLLRLDGPMRRALTLEVGMQNAGLGTVLVLELFPGQTAAAVPTALYTFGCMFTGTLLARLWAGRPMLKAGERS